MLTVKEVADRLGKSPSTIRNYHAQFGDYLNQAGRSAGEDREYTDQDLAVLATVASMKKVKKKNAAIRASLDAGDLVDIPPDPAKSHQDTPQSSALMSEREIRLSTTVAKFEGELVATKAENVRLVADLADVRAAHLSEVERRAAAEAKLEQIERKAVISVVHSLDGKPPPDLQPPWWQFWRRE
jgi:DNA-binding transcriptional MerR regulator